ncbi:bacteriocin-like protein [Chryseobacterium sp. c4a]|uniref:bacteriocin-like protein n=1 Tax=Chryseobacterium sp. c4a TaxID=1573582 RepID=UPI00135BF547|nr:hypothetical protein [Chryseobacterium sp. c4a]
MKNFKKLSREDLKKLAGGNGVKCELMRGNIVCDDQDAGTQGCKECVSCPNRQGSQSCYTDPNGNCAEAKRKAASLC